MCIQIAGFCTGPISYCEQNGQKKEKEFKHPVKKVYNCWALVNQEGLFRVV